MRPLPPLSRFALWLLPFAVASALGCGSDPTQKLRDGSTALDGGPLGDAMSTGDGGNGPGESGAQCADRLDNDADGLADCEDPDCATTTECGGAGDGGKTDSSGACETARGDGVATKSPVDVVWVIDNSFSMLDDIMRVQQNMSAFTNSLVTEGLDYQVVVLNAPASTWDATTLGVDPDRFVALDVIAFNECFSPALGAFGQYSSYLRDDAALHFIMVTDDNSAMSWSSFQSQMSGNLGGRDFTVHAIVDPPEHCLGSTQHGSAYWEAAAATGGQQRSICESDWTPTFRAIEDSIRSTAVIPCQYAIPEPPSGQTYDRSKVNVLYVDGNGTTTPFTRKASMDECGSDQSWYYDDPADPTQVLLCPEACTFAEQQGGSVNVEFVCNAAMLY